MSAKLTPRARARPTEISAIAAKQGQLQLLVMFHMKHSSDNTVDELPD